MTKTNNAFAFTHNRLEAINPPNKGRNSYRDTKVVGLNFVITANNSKSFYLVKWIKGKTVRIRIGNYQNVTIEDARRITQKYLVEIAQGKNHNEEKKLITNAPTLTDLFKYWLKTYAKSHKKTWKTDIRVFKKYCKKIRKIKLPELEKVHINKWHKSLGKKHGKYQANRTYQLIRSLFRVADEIGYKGINPCIGVKMFPEKSRERFLLPNELKQWHDAVAQEEPLWKDLILMTLFTGQRKSNVCQMKWKDVDIIQRLWFVEGEQLKNGSPLVVVLSQQACEILEARQHLPDKNETWVFPAKHKKDAPVQSMRAAWDRVRQHSQLNDIRIHDLRRTLGSWQALTGTSLQIIAGSLGHKTIKSTEIYARLLISTIRESVEKATQKIVEHWENNKDNLTPTE